MTISPKLQEGQITHRHGIQTVTACDLRWRRTGARQGQDIHELGCHDYFRVERLFLLAELAPKHFSFLNRSSFSVSGTGGSGDSNFERIALLLD